MPPLSCPLDFAEIKNLYERKPLEEIDEMLMPKDFGQYYKYGYQGQFAMEDSETGWNSFELRMYDATIGRWNVVDPYRQHASPFVSMGNNPISRVDPDGGFDWFRDPETGEPVWLSATETFTDNAGNYGSIYQVIQILLLLLTIGILTM